MLYRDIIAVYSEIHTKHINTLCGQNVELLNIKLSVHIVTRVWGSIVVKALRYQCHWGFFYVATDGTMCPGVDSASKNEYQGFLRG
jgi:hypothetical protein